MAIAPVALASVVALLPMAIEVDSAGIGLQAVCAEPVILLPPIETPFSSSSMTESEVATHSSDGPTMTPSTSSTDSVIGAPAAAFADDVGRVDAKGAGDGSTVDRSISGSRESVTPRSAPPLRL